MGKKTKILKLKKTLKFKSAYLGSCKRQSEADENFGSHGLQWVLKKNCKSFSVDTSCIISDANYSLEMWVWEFTQF